eukprot:Gregarina_sp_Poly_1__9396@NODE_587_length_7368_cov_122_746473_g453_i0_p4_GENE_NODE_587_length_7368_cov_122_746473_g453_i0NODE_587_length_7368_cov_122_746473_g453_i0_p4_ORF_typecomplete_len294_score29_41_NODE_587_length_7368_cov_122_746473_g453_i050135894
MLPTPWTVARPFGAPKIYANSAELRRNSMSCSILAEVALCDSAQVSKPQSTTKRQLRGQRRATALEPWGFRFLAIRGVGGVGDGGEEYGGEGDSTVAHGIWSLEGTSRLLRGVSSAETETRRLFNSLSTERVGGDIGVVSGAGEAGGGIVGEIVGGATSEFGGGNTPPLKGDGRMAGDCSRREGGGMGTGRMAGNDAASPTGATPSVSNPGGGGGGGGGGITGDAANGASTTSPGGGGTGISDSGTGGETARSGEGDAGGAMVIGGGGGNSSGESTTIDSNSIGGHITTSSFI